MINGDEKKKGTGKASARSLVVRGMFFKAGLNPPLLKMMPKAIPLVFSLLTLFTHPPHLPKVVRNVRLSTPGVRYRTVMSAFLS
jgi:hypothetical protein